MDGDGFEMSVTDDDRVAGEALGFTDMRMVFGVAGPVVWVRWRGAPVAIKSGGRLGGFGVTFYRGETEPPGAIADHDRPQWNEWDEVLDTGEGDPQTLMELAAFVLDRYGDGREELYAEVAFPELPGPLPEPGTDSGSQ